MAADIALVPPQRLGVLLTEARARTGATLPELAGRSGGRFAVADLLALEAGGRELTDDTVRAVTELYELDPGTLAPERSRLVIDLDERTIAAGDTRTQLPAPTADEVLATYLSLVYTMRHSTPGTPLPLRHADIDVLSRALELASNDIETRLVELMADPDQQVSHTHRRLRRRVLIPVAGVVVAATAVGTILMVNRSTSTPTVVVPVTVVEQPGPVPPVSLIDPIVVERNPDGSPGPTMVPTPPVVSAPDSLPGAAVPDGQSALIDPVVVERNPDGTPGEQHVRGADPTTSSPTTTTTTTTAAPAPGSP